MNQIIAVPDIAVLKTENGTKRLYSLREQKIMKDAVLQTFDIGSGIKYGGDLYVLDNPDVEIVRMTTGKIDPSFTISKTSDIRVDWGDGVVETNVFAHTYTDGVAVHEVVFWGKLTALTLFGCRACQLTTLDVSKNVALTWLDCQSNQLTTLDISTNVTLVDLFCSNNQLTALDISKNIALTRLACPNNQLTTLDVSTNVALIHLYFSDNQLTALNVLKNVALTWLDCSINQLTTLDVSANVALTRLDCNNNQLTTLDVSTNVVLTWLCSSANQLTTLNVSANVALSDLYVYANPFITNSLSLTAMANSLPDRNGLKTGTIDIGVIDTDTESIITAKNWNVS